MSRQRRKRAEPSPQATALNPLVLVEVTSDSSEEYDTTTKADSYRTIPSLAAYLIVSHRERRLTLHAREPNGEFETRVAISGGKLPLLALGTELLVDEVYRGSSIPG